MTFLILNFSFSKAFKNFRSFHSCPFQESLINKLKNSYPNININKTIYFSFALPESKYNDLDLIQNMRCYLLSYEPNPMNLIIVSIVFNEPLTMSIEEISCSEYNPNFDIEKVVLKSLDIKYCDEYINSYYSNIYLSSRDVLQKFGYSWKYIDYDIDYIALTYNENDPLDNYKLVIKKVDNQNLFSNWFNKIFNKGYEKISTYDHK